MATKANKKKAPRKKASEESVLDRAKRYHRSRTTQQLKQLSEQLGLPEVKSFEELQQVLAAKGSAAPSPKGEGAGQGEGKEEQHSELKAELERARAELRRYKSAYAKVYKQRDELREEVDAIKAESEIKEACLSAGVQDPELAMHLFRDYLTKNGEEAEYAEDPKGFFESLKADPKRRVLFEAPEVPAGPSPVGQQAPKQEGQQAAQEQQPEPPKPPPTPAERSPNPPQDPPEDVSNLDRQEFQKRTEQKYGYRPSL